MSPSTLQYSATAATPVPAAGTSTVLVTTAPVVGKPIEAAGIVKPLSSVQVLATCAGGGGAGLSLPPQALSARTAAASALSFKEVFLREMVMSQPSCVDLFVYRLVTHACFGPAKLQQSEAIRRNLLKPNA